jgi:hypothetical protein
MFEYTLETETVVGGLTAEGKSRIAEDIGRLFVQWDDARAKQKRIAEKLRTEIYLDDRIRRYTEEEDLWKSDLHLNKIYSLFQTQQAYIWENIYANIENVFDVAGLDERSCQTAPLQKQKLVNVFYQIGLQNKLDTAIEHLSSIGEACLFIGWRKKYKSVRRLLEHRSLPENGSSVGRKMYGILDREIYNGADVEVINPLNLVFDPCVRPEDTDKWDACGKIVKSWETYDEIVSNTLYCLDEEEKRTLRDLLLAGDNGMPRPLGDKLGDVTDDHRIEVLQYWGNYTAQDGTVLKNRHIVVIGRRYVARFAVNNWVINPLIDVALFRDAASGRGIPELWSIYDLCKEQENKVNLQNDAQMLNLNPPAYAPEGFFKEEILKLSPGRQVSYKAGLEDPTAIIKMSFPLIKNEDIIQYYDTTASNVSGIFPNMQGQQEFRNATATEIRVKVQGQTTRLGKTVDTIKQNLIVPMVEKVAELESNMKFGSEKLYVRKDIGCGVCDINDEIRQGHYAYRYTDSGGIQQKFALNQTMTQILQPVWNDQSVPLNKIEIIKEGLRNIGIENTEKFFNTTEERAATSMPPQNLFMQNRR